MRSGSSDGLAASLAHHIRTPLATALLYMHLIDRELGSGINQQLREGLAGARDEMVRLDRLLGSLVDYHQLGRVVLQPALVDANSIVREAVARTARALSAEIRVEVAAEKLIDWWDGGALDEIVQTLLAHAIQNGNAPFSISVARAADKLQVRVREGGGMSSRGLSPALRKRLSAPRERTSGTDVRLWLVGQLAAAHGGSVNAAVDRQGGTVVSITLAPDRPQKVASRVTSPVRRPRPRA